MFMTDVLCIFCGVQVYFKSWSTSGSLSQGQKLWYHVKGLVTRNTHEQYECPIISCLKVMAKVKLFVHGTDADEEAGGRATTLAPRTYLSRLAKK